MRLPAIQHWINNWCIWILAAYDVVRIYDVVRAWRTMSYVQHTTSRCTSYVRCRTCYIQDIDVRHRTCDMARHVRCRTSTYDIVCHTYDIVCCHLHISYTMSYVGNGHAMSYVHDIRYRRFISYTTSYARTMSHVNIRYWMSDVRCRTSFRGGRFRCFKRTIIPFIIRIPCTILVIAVLRRQGWNRASKDNDVLWCYLISESGGSKFV